MKTLFIATLLAAACQPCLGAGFIARWESPRIADMPHFEMERVPFGSGTPAGGATTGTESAYPVADGLYHVPNYLPGFPTAATIWPRELPVDCDSDIADNSLRCTGYRVIPAVGRGEYIFVRPTRKEVRLPLPPLPEKPVPVTHKKPLE